MSRSNIQHVRTWSRSCDVAVHVYRALGELPDRHFADRVIQNAFTIPEGVAAAFQSNRFTNRHDALTRSLEALAVLQTQLYLARECGMLADEHMSAICSEAADLSVDLQSQHRTESSDEAD
jgi:four helix bundle protein